MSSGRWTRRPRRWILDGSRTPAQRWRGPVLALAVGLVAVAGLADAAVVEGQYEHGNETDDTAPTMTRGTPVNDTAFEVTIADDHDVDESTIDADDFLLETGSLENVTVSEDGSNATVQFLLSDPVDDENLTVVVQDDAVIQDTNGNAVSSDEFVIVPGMDGVAPAVREFSVTNATGEPATIRVSVTEKLHSFHVSVGGPGDDHLTASSFEATDSGYSYERTYTPPGDGTVYFTLENVTDHAGNTREVRFRERILADLTPPTPVATLDLATSANLSMTFDGGLSRDANGVANYTWNFGDGERATGARVSHDYLPGNYTVTLDVSDPYGNTATDTLTLNLTSGAGNVTDVDESLLRERTGSDQKVTVERPGDNVTSDALVSVDGALRNETIRTGAVDGEGTPLASAESVSLDGVTVTLSINRSFDLGVSMAGNGSVADAARATGTRALAGITLVNTVPDDEIENATIRFSVTQSRLRALDATPENVSLYRYHGGDWNQLQTTALNATNETQPFHAETPGFSRFAVATDPGAVFTVTDATLDTPTVTPGDPFSVTVTVENGGSDDGRFTVGLEANGTVVTTETTSIAAGETATVTLWSQSPEVGRFALSVNGTDAGTLTVSESQGSTDQPDANETNDQFVVTDATLSTDRVDVDEPFTVNATIENRGDQRGQYTAALAVNGTVYSTKTRPIPAGESLTVQLTGTVNRSGEFPVSVNGTDAGTLTVGDGEEERDDSGLLSSVVGMLGVLPIGLLKPLFLFVLLPIAVIYGALKALAIYLGY